MSAKEQQPPADSDVEIISPDLPEVGILATLPAGTVSQAISPT